MKDKFNREIDYMRISVTDKCSLRCIYCMEEDDNTFLNDDKILTDDEILRITNISASLGIKKIRITGGEPFARKNLSQLITNINNIDGIDEIYITTNGIAGHQDIKKMKQNGVCGFNISLDSLIAKEFKKITRFDEIKNVQKFIDVALENNLSVKLNVVVMKGINDGEIIDFAKMSLDKNIDVRFIELMPIGMGSKFIPVKTAKVYEIIKNAFEISAENNMNSGPAKYIKIKNSIGRVGFISAMSDCFCDDCNRIRLTADGFLKQCLHFNCGISLRDLIRNGACDLQIKEAIENTIYDKPEKHLFNEISENKELKKMHEIGG